MGLTMNEKRSVAAQMADESAVGYSLVGCSPAEPTSASPTGGNSSEGSGAFAIINFGHFLT
jgi:hypothetical protein